MGRLQQGHAFHSHQACPKVSIPKSSQTTLANDDSYDLPDDVFVEGETRPTKKKKGKKAKESTPAAETLPKKRSLNNAGLDVSIKHARYTSSYAASFVVSQY